MLIGHFRDVPEVLTTMWKIQPMYKEGHELVCRL
jgi:hypothetical protein